jgi:hypothetical protein
MAKKILFVFEGEKTEKQITNNLTKYFLNEDTVIQCSYCTDIYMLHRKISEDKDLDTFVLLKKIEENEEILSEYNRDDFAEIYMFFDYDGHATLASDDKIREILNFFNEETSSGKLFISYPMVEALKHISDPSEFKKLKIKAKENIGYKNVVSEECKKELINLTAYTKDTWVQLIELHLKKMNHIVTEDYSLPKESISQDDIFSNQLNKYINIDATVAVLSSFPVFLFDYYGHKYISELLPKNQT